MLRKDVTPQTQVREGDYHPAPFNSGGNSGGRGRVGWRGRQSSSLACVETDRRKGKIDRCSIILLLDNSSSASQGQGE